jgi:Family of unknown function (DUF6062)
MCWPHARERLLHAPTCHGTERTVLASRYESLAAELRELIRKSDWNNRDEARGAEQDAWLRALHALAGVPSESSSESNYVSGEAPRRSSRLPSSIRRVWRRLRPPKPVVLDLAGIKLEAALNHAGCPVCHLATESTRRWLFMLLWEGVMDPEIRGRIRLADGFCSRHWWRLLEVERKEMHSITGIAILAEDIITSLAEQLQANRLPAGPTKRGCLACQAHRRGEEGALAGLARHITRPEFRATYITSPGCCSGHRRALSSRVEQPELASLVLDHGV